MHLAGFCEGVRASVDDIAVATAVAPSVMSKILQRLASAHLVISHRGKGGGFALARPAAGISLLEVVTAVDGPLCLNVCLPSGNACDRRSWCAAHLVWAEVQRNMAATLAAATLDQLAHMTDQRRQVLATG